MKPESPPLKTRSADLPQLPDGWDYRPLSTLVNQERGISYGIVQPGAAVAGGVPIIRVNNIRSGRISTDDLLHVAASVESKYARTRLRGGELLLTLVGTLGESAVVPADLAGWNVARAVAVIPVLVETGARWAAICLRWQPLQHFMRTRATTTVQATLNLRDVAQIPIPMPPDKIRAKLSDTLGNLDEKIELNRQMNETLEAMARAVFRSWFVDFDPVRRKINRAGGDNPRFPPLRQQPGVVTPGSEWDHLFPDSFEDSPLGPVPKGWRVGNLGEIAINPRRGIDAADVPPGTAYIGLEHMPRKSISLSNWESAPEIESNKFCFKRREILFGKLRPYFHKVGVAPIDGVCSTDILVIKPKAIDWFGFALCHFSSDELVMHADSTSTGTKMPRTNWSDLANYEVVLPDEEIARRFNAWVEPLVNRIIAGIEEGRSLAAIRDALLPKLLSGEVRVKAPEGAVP